MSELGDGDSDGLPTFIICDDNLDKTINPRFMASEHQRKSLHFFHSYAVIDQVKCGHLPSNRPTGDLKSLPVSTYLPDSSDCKILFENYATLLARVLVRDIPYFSILQRLCTTAYSTSPFSQAESAIPHSKF